MSRDRPDAQIGGEAPGYDPSAYGDRLGADYDVLYPSHGLETTAMVDFIAELATRSPSRSVLEFGIGTGRLALELQRRGLLVAGIDASTRMVEALREKDPGGTIEVAVGDYVSTRVSRLFSVVALVFNNVLDPRGLPAQLALFENAARHLTPGGFFVIEAFVLSDAARSGDWSVAPRYVGIEHAELQMMRFDIETSTIERTLVHLRPQGAQFIEVRDAYAGPGELDVMAHVHGMSRVARYASWDRAPYTAFSRRHVTVYELR
jgi:SAM-dependent methyltransferase